AQQLYLLVNGRYETRRPTIVTTNRLLADLEATVGPRVVSRLTEDFEPVGMTGDDVRRRS
ncbi:MAG: ATP-binding protein, partial [Chloroflexota bacterium]|nr:ATP-binding protein [Chloroflexota bacterium]